MAGQEDLIAGLRGHDVGGGGGAGGGQFDAQLLELSLGVVRGGHEDSLMCWVNKYE